jgi:toxin YoeB
VSWKLVYAEAARKDAKLLAAAGLKPKAERLLAVIEQNPFASPPRYEELVGDLSGAYSRRINIHHRLVYEVLPRAAGEEYDGVVKVLRMWGHYE